MKKTFSLLAALVLGFAGVAASAHASPILQAHVPFDFTVSSSTFSAGDYTFSKLSENIWTIRNDKTKQAISALVTSFGTNQDQNPAKLVFKHAGSSYFLYEVHSLGETSVAPPSKTERSMEREMARNRTKPESIYVLASAR